MFNIEYRRICSALMFHEQPPQLEHSIFDIFRCLSPTTENPNLNKDLFRPHVS